ncbi:hypothetical protein EV183_003703 [Coemansia sp. RSA 2336]|nr:hypothetical protein EV183_003703 [Coemansia sp. RSA 2336]
MKFGVAWVALAATISAADDVSVNPNQSKIWDAVPQDLVAAGSYFPESFIKALMLGDGALPTNAEDALALASNMPDEEKSKISPLYEQFIKDAGSLLPTPTETTSSSTSSSESSPTTTEDSESNSSEESDDSSEELSDFYYSPNTRILVITPPPVSERLIRAKRASPPDIFSNERTAKYAEAAKQVAREAQVPFVDLYTEIETRVARKHGASKYGGYEDYLYDGVHLGYSGHTLLYDLICKAIRDNWPELFPQKLPP